MTAVPETSRRIAYNGPLKKLVIVGTAATATGNTVDTNTDVADAKGRVFEKIIDAYHVGTTGTRVDASWVNATGIVTLGTIAGSPATVNVVIEGW
jgi:hypothetical protein